MSRRRQEPDLNDCCPLCGGPVILSLGRVAVAPHDAQKGLFPDPVVVQAVLWTCADQSCKAGAGPRKK